MIHEGKRLTMTGAYKGANAGDMLFHQQGWDPVFLDGLDASALVDLNAIMQGQVCITSMVC